MTQIAASVNSCYSSNAVTMRGGKATRDPPYPNMTRKPARKDNQDEEDKVEEVELPSTEESTKFNGKVAPHEFYDTNLLMPFPRTRTQKTNEQFGKFVGVIRQLYVNIPLLDAMEVPTYTKYLRDILNNKKPLPKTEVVKLTEECSEVILNKFPKKKKAPGCPTIDCSIGTQYFDMHCATWEQASVSCQR